MTAMDVFLCVWLGVIGLCLIGMMIVVFYGAATFLYDDIQERRRRR